MTKLNENELKNITGAGGAGDADADPEMGVYERPNQGDDDSSGGGGGGGGGGTPIDEDPPIQEL